MRWTWLALSLMVVVGALYLQDWRQWQRDRQRMYDLEREHFMAGWNNTTMPAADQDELDRLHAEAVRHGELQ